VKLIDGESGSSLDFKIHCAQRLPRYAIPHRFEFVHQTLPVSSTGKIDRRRVTLGLINNMRTRVVQEIEQ
jgi:acyl-CoA synthetase (AMP-forming)/AMP-acid ligase II